jgi:hypothetical protein
MKWRRHRTPTPTAVKTLARHPVAGSDIDPQVDTEHRHCERAARADSRRHVAMADVVADNAIYCGSASVSKMKQPGLKTP